MIGFFRDFMTATTVADQVRFLKLVQQSAIDCISKDDPKWKGKEDDIPKAAETGKKAPETPQGESKYHTLSVMLQS